MGFWIKLQSLVYVVTSHIVHMNSNEQKFRVDIETSFFVKCFLYRNRI